MDNISLFLRENDIFILALVGALAWLPPLIQLIIRITSKPKLTIIIQDQSEIGYTTNGPIVNLFIALSTENIGCLVTKISLDVEGPNQSHHLFKWEWFEETFYEIGRADLGQAMPVRKNQTAIALKILREGLVEKKMGFHETSFKTLSATNFKQTTERYINIQQGGQSIETLKASTEYNNYRNMFENSCFWTDGEYSIVVRVYVLHVADPFQKQVKFRLSAIDVRNLTRNIRTCVRVLELHYFSETPLPEAVPIIEPTNIIEDENEVEVVNTAESNNEIKWNWATPRIEE